MIDERAFFPGWLESQPALDLVVLQHELRRHPEDKPYLDQVLRELGRRQQRLPATPQEPEP